jgi:hypothetical protein
MDAYCVRAIHQKGSDIENPKRYEEKGLAVKVAEYELYENGIEDKVRLLGHENQVGLFLTYLIHSYKVIVGFEVWANGKHVLSTPDIQVASETYDSINR